SAADADQALITPRASDVVLLDVTRAAVELEALVRDLRRELADEDLRHRDHLHGLEADGLLPDVLLVVVHLDGLVRERLRGLELRLQVDELVLPVFALDDRLAERLALATVGDRLVDD